MRIVYRTSWRIADSRCPRASGISLRPQFRCISKRSARQEKRQRIAHQPVKGTDATQRIAFEAQPPLTKMPAAQAQVFERPSDYLLLDGTQPSSEVSRKIQLRAHQPIDGIERIAQAYGERVARPGHDIPV